MAELVVHVQELDEAGKDYAFELDPALLDALLADAGVRADPEFGPGSLDVHAQENGQEYLVTGQLEAHLVTECGRCLADAKVPVSVQIAALYSRLPNPVKNPKATEAASAAKAAAAAAAATKKPAKAPRPRHEPEVVELDEDDLQRETFTGNDIALADLVREHLVLEVPMQPLCSEQCEGIPVPQHLRPPADTFTSDGAVDPRLAPLQRLRDNVPAKSLPDPVTPTKPNRQSK